MANAIEAKQTIPNPKMASGRVVNAVAEMLNRQLHIPNIYLKPELPGAHSVDILAVDRAGSGDLHAVKILIAALAGPKALGLELLVALSRAKRDPFHFYYLVVPAGAVTEERGLRLVKAADLFDDSGIGRVGIVALQSELQVAGDPPQARLVVKPERFRMREDSLKRIERFLEKTKPDMAVRI